MRGRMSPAKSYAAGVKIGEVMTAEAVSQVVESRHGGLSKGDMVLGRSGWQSHSVLKGDALRKLDPAAAPLTTALGVMGMPGYTAYSGLKLHGRPRPGETVAVSAASGAVGQVVGQLAKIIGCRAVGIAGGPEKCAMTTGTFGFDECVDYKATDFRDRLAAACPDGIDVYFENVAGDVLKAVIPLMNDFGRIPVCGIIAYYNLQGLPEGPDGLPLVMGAILRKRLTVRGFINYDDLDLHDDFLREVGGWIREGRVKYVEDIVPGLENAVGAFQGLLTGRNKGKLIIQVADDPTR
jgi:NADPH-dependent curcumin reductase CurA